MFGLLVKMFGVPTCCVRVLAFECQLCCSFQLPANTHTGRQQVMAHVLGPCHPFGRPGFNSQLSTPSYGLPLA